MLKLKLQYFGNLMWRTHLKRPWFWERLKAWAEGDDRGWDGWMASLTLWTWVWVSSGSWWWTGGPGVLQSIGSQRVRQDWVTELNWTEPKSERMEKMEKVFTKIYSLSQSFPTVLSVRTFFPWPQYSGALGINYTLKKFTYIFIWLCQVLVAAGRI